MAYHINSPKNTDHLKTGKKNMKNLPAKDTYSITDSSLFKQKHREANKWTAWSMMILGDTVRVTCTENTTKQ